MGRRAVAVLLAAVVAAGCGDGGGERARPTTTTASSTSSIPATESTPAPVAPPTTISPLAPIEGCADPGALALPDPARPVYAGEIDVDMTSGRIAGLVHVRFTPDLDIGELVFRLWPNAPSLVAVGTSSTVATVQRVPTGEALPLEVRDPTTVVAATGPLPAHQPVEVQVAFEVAVAGPASDRVSLDRDTLRLGSYVPLLAWEPGAGWALEPPTSLFAEAVTSPVADFDLAIGVTEGYDLLATGLPGADGVWRASAVRDVALSVGHFDTVTATEQLPADVVVTVGVDRSVGEGPDAYLERVRAALRDFTARYGAYPWSTFTLAVTPGLEGGIEFPTHVMQGPGTVGRTTPHEVGHMWFYALVGNDQARDPWLDEALASYVEFVHEGVMDEASSRDIPADAEGRGGEPMTYWEEHRASYYRGVYLQPAVALASLGDPSMVDCALRHYVATSAYSIATPDDLLAALTVVFPDAGDRLGSAGLYP
jgi:hypothetical protein